MAFKITGSIVLLWITSFASVAQADVVWIVGQDDPIYGIVESSDEQQIVFRETVDGQKFSARTIQRSSIETLVINHDPQQLAKLPSGQWETWLSLAETLHAQKKDPVARNLAIRVLVIVVANSERENQRQTAIEELVSLARSESERQKFNQLRYLETGHGSVPKKIAGEFENFESSEKKAVADLVRRVRLQETSTEELSRNGKAKEIVLSLDEVCSWEDLLQMSRTNRIDEPSLRRLVELELKLRQNSDGGSENATRSDWHVLAQQVGHHELTLPRIENVTEFDPRATRFADGKWMKP